MRDQLRANNRLCLLFTEVAREKASFFSVVHLLGVEREPGALCYRAEDHTEAHAASANQNLSNQYDTLLLTRNLHPHK